MKGCVRALLGVCLLAGNVSGYCQSLPFDSLINRIDALSTDFDSSEYYLLLDESGYYLTTGRNVETDVGDIALSWAFFYEYSYSFDSCIKYYQLAYDFFTQSQDSANIGISQYGLAAAYYEVKEYILSTELYLENLELYKNIGTDIDVAEVLNAIGGNYYFSGHPGIAENFFLQSIEMYRKTDDKPGLAMVLGNLAALYNGKGQSDSALDLYNEATEIVVAEKDTLQIVDMYMGIGLVHQEMGHLEEAYEFFRQALNISIEKDYTSLIGFSYQNLGYYYLDKDLFDSARWYGLKALNYSDKISNFQLWENAQEILHEAYYGLRQYEKAYDVLAALSTAEDSVFTLSSTRQLNALEIQYNTEKREKELAQTSLELEQKNSLVKAQKNQRNALIGSVLILLVIITLVVRSQRLNRRAKQLLLTKNREIQEKNKEIQKIQKSKNKWFLNIAHELRTPLTLVKGPIEYLNQAKEFDEDGKALLQIATRNVTQLENLTNEILDLSRLEEGKIHLEKEYVNLSKLVASVVDSFDEFARKNDIALMFDYPLGTPIPMNLDVGKFEKALNNLISNAIKFTPQKGEVKIHLTENAKLIILRVSDTGVGIDKAEIPHIFDRYYQASNQKLSTSGGSGVGLSLSREIIELHGGSIQVESEVGVGSTFEVLLPSSLKALDSDLESPDQHEADGRDGKPHLKARDKVIYLADDNLDMREYITSFLDDKFVVKHFRDGKEVLMEVEKKIPHLIISDIMMPRMDGVALARKLKENPEWRKIPFISVTAITNEQEKLDTLRTGVDDYITKPFNPEELLIRIENLLINYSERQLSTEFEDVEVETFEERLINKLEEEVKAHIADPDFNVIRLADAGSLSERQLYRYLKQTTGYTPANFVKEIRLQRAFELARRGVYGTTAELSYAVGFQHPSYFTSVFKKRFGKKPSDFLKEA